LVWVDPVPLIRLIDRPLNFVIGQFRCDVEEGADGLGDGDVQAGTDVSDP
jgi:hypothetical protein